METSTKPKDWKMVEEGGIDMKVDDADIIGIYPVIAQWDNGKYVVLVGEHTESEDYDEYEDAIKHLEDYSNALK